MNSNSYPDLTYNSWQNTKTTLHLFTQIVGKIRMALNPVMNHWWHVPLYITARGLGTRTIPVDRRNIELEFDFIDHRAVITTSNGDRESLNLENCSVAQFYSQVLQAMSRLNIVVDIVPLPFDAAKTGSEIPYADDTVHASYDRDAVGRFHTALTRIEPVFKRFQGRFVGKCSPIHFFWHSFDLALTRFSGKAVEVSPEADPVTREAYSHEVISVGFWPGDNTFPEAAFYAYVHPEPKGLEQKLLLPKAAWWQKLESTHMALLRYDDLLKSADPDSALLDFFQSSYDAGADLAGWVRQDLEIVR